MAPAAMSCIMAGAGRGAIRHRYSSFRHEGFRHRFELAFRRGAVAAFVASPEVERVTGIDLKPPRFAYAKFHATQLDIRSPRLERELAGHDALVHLAGIALAGAKSHDEMFDINVNGGHKAFHTARQCGARRLIHLSSAAVYGRSVHLGEHAPLDPMPACVHAVHQAHLGRLLEIEFPECTRLRLHILLGPHSRPELKRLLGLPCYVRLPEPQPLLQCAHEDDVARAGLDAARRWFGWKGDPAWVEGLTRTLLVNCRRAAVELGWRSTRSAASVLAQT
jgi:UDP-glucose 4-epimerase